MNVVDPISTPDETSSSSVSSGRASPIRRIAVAVVVASVFTACATDPGPKRVATDIINAESIRNPELDEECLLRELNRYTDDDLRRISSNLQSDNTAAREEGESAVQAYQRSLEGCL